MYQKRYTSYSRVLSGWQRLVYCQSILSFRFNRMLQVLCCASRGRRGTLFTSLLCASLAICSVAPTRALGRETQFRRTSCSEPDRGCIYLGTANPVKLSGSIRSSIRR